MKTNKSQWRKIKGKWVNLAELSEAAGTPRPTACSDFKQTYSFSGRTNKKSNYIPSHILDRHNK